MGSAKPHKSWHRQCHCLSICIIVLQWDEQACLSCHGFRQATLLDDDDDDDDDNEDDCDDDGGFRTRVEDDNDDK